MSKRLTKHEVQAMMDRLERKPTVENMRLAAALLKVGFEIDIDGGLLYRGAFYPDRDALVDEILIDLGSRRNSL